MIIAISRLLTPNCTSLHKLQSAAGNILQSHVMIAQGTVFESGSGIIDQCFCFLQHMSDDLLSSQWVQSGLSFFLNLVKTMTGFGERSTVYDVPSCLANSIPVLDHQLAYE